MKKYLVFTILFTLSASAHTIFNGNEPFFELLIYIMVVYQIYWLPILAVIGFFLCIFKACRIFGYLIGAIFVLIAFTMLIGFVSSAIENQIRKPYHEFATNCGFAEYDDKLLYKKSESNIVNMFEINGYYEANGMLHCKAFEAKLDTNTTLRARCRYNYLYILQKNGKIPHYSPKSRYKDKATLKMSDFKMRYYIDYANKKDFYSYEINFCRYTTKNCYDSNSKVLYIDNHKIKMPKKPKFASIANDGIGLYVVYKDEPKKIYLLHDSKKKIYEVVQDAAKSVINSAYIPWWSFYKSPYDTISKEQLKEIRSFSKDNWVIYRYKIKRVDKNIFDVDVTCDDEKYRYLHFKIKYEKFNIKPLEFKILKKDFFTKETKRLAKEFLEDKTPYYKTETLLKLKALQENAKSNTDMPKEIEQIIKKNFLENLGSKKGVYEDFLKNNKCFNLFFEQNFNNYRVDLNFLLRKYKKYIKRNCL